MTNLALVGHFSTVLGVAWIVWLLWCAGQVLWYRRATTAMAAVAPVAEPQPKAQPDRVTALRAPDATVRSMSPAPALRAATPPIVEASTDATGESAASDPMAATPPADEPVANESRKDRKKRRKREREAARAAEAAGSHAEVKPPE